MKWRAERFTVRRKLAAACVAYLAGVGLTALFRAPMWVICALCAFLAGFGVYRHARNRSALFYVLVLVALMGHGRAAHVLSIRDAATDPGVFITGTVSGKVNDTRVYLVDVTVDGEAALHRPAVVTLMCEEGEAAGTVLVGQRVSGTGRLFEPEGVRNPGGIDERVQALCKGYDLSGYILPGWTAEGEERFSLTEAFRRAREALRVRLEALFGGEAPIFEAIMLGSRERMEDDVVRAMRLAGVAHVLVVSGMHLSLIARATQALLRRTPLSRRLRFAAQAMLLGMYCLLTGGAPGTTRAYVMTLLRELAPLVGKRYEPITALAVAALITTAINPIWALNASFQFSYFVVLGILLISRQISAFLNGTDETRRRCRRIFGSLSLSASAQIAALPMQLLLYGFVPLLALPMNVLCGALMPMLLLGGWGAALVSLFSMRLGGALATVIALPARLMERLSLAAASCSWGIVRLPAPLTVSLVLYAMLMAACSRQIRIKRGRRRMAVTLVMLLALGYLPRLCGAARYVQLDVRQGDGALLRQGRRAVLVDVGPEDEYAMLRYLRHEGLTVDAVILSHLDEDHAGALATLINSEVRVPRVVMAEGAMDGEVSAVVTQALGAARQAGVTLEWVSAGARIEAAGFALDVLSPDERLTGSNERSLVLTGDVGGMTLLLLGDLPSSCEMDDVPDCDILKVAHHGSRYATSANLIRAATPQAALISVGRNSYGHPAQRVIDDLRQAGARIYRTDEAGCVTIWPGVRVETFVH